MTLRLIASGAYVGQELAAEFGQLPPAFLPLGETRLYEHQRTLFPAGEPVHMTLPDSFAPEPHDVRRLAELGVEVVRVPDGLRLGESVLYAINSIMAAPGPLLLLHGDTLLAELPGGDDDFIATSAETDDYSWAEVDVFEGRALRLETVAAAAQAAGRRPVACGCFGLSSTALFARAITQARGDFVSAVNGLAADRPVHAAPAKGWRDFGHSQTYFRSRQAVATSRSFNSLRIGPGVVRKSSRDTAKMAAEARWLRDCPGDVRLFAARVLDAGESEGSGFYETAYSYAPTLAELNVFSRVGAATWRRILNSCLEFLNRAAAHGGPGSGDAALRELAVDKTVSRLEAFARAGGRPIDAPVRTRGRALPSLLELASELAARIDLRSGRAETLMHGDFCFGNLLYDSRAARITAIDPRGYVRPGVASMFGDLRYDLAKLAHSIRGRYDHIMAGRYRLEYGDDLPAIVFDDTPHQPWLEASLDAMEVSGVKASSVEVKAITASLFLSMLPLHADRPDRQTAFIANAYRLFDELERDAR